MIYTLKQLLNPIDSDRLETLNKIAGIIAGNHKSSLIIGAFARDLLFYHLHNISAGTATFDMDFSIKMISWNDFDAMAEKMDKLGLKQTKLPDHPEKFIDGNGVELDLIPFGEICEDSKELIWPDGTPWNTLGIVEALKHSWSLDLGKTRLNIANAAAIVMLKIFAVTERPDDRKHKDVRDINFILKQYLNVGNRERLMEGGGKHQFLNDEAPGELNKVATRLLGYDIGKICSQETFSELDEILKWEITSKSRCVINHELRKYFNGNFNEARKILSLIRSGIKEGYQEKQE